MRSTDRNSRTRRASSAPLFEVPAPLSPFVGLMRIADGARASSSLGASAGEPGAPKKGKARAAWSGQERRLSVAPVVLIVDDEPDQIDVYRQFLDFAGYRVAVANGGAVALDVALATKPDVIIMDLAMPGMDGFEATRRIKELRAMRDVPVIALSACGDIRPEWVRAAGCETYLRKPVLPQELFQEIERVMARARRR